MMKAPDKTKYILLVFFVSCITYGQGHINPARIATGVAVSEEIHPAQLCLKLRELPADEKQKLRNELKRVLANPDELNGTGGKGDFEMYLIALDDSETIARVVEKYFKDIRGDSAFFLEFSGNPAVIAMLGDELLKNNQSRSLSEDTAMDGVASTAWNVIRRIIRYAPEFSGELKTWAGETKLFIFADEPGDPTGGGQEDIAILREWWKANREAFRAGEFAQVKPGATWPMREKPKIDVYVPSGNQTTGSPGNNPADFAGQKAPASSEQTRDEISFFWMGAAIVGVVLAGWFFVRRIPQPTR